MLRRQVVISGQSLIRCRRYQHVASATSLQSGVFVNDATTQHICMDFRGASSQIATMNYKFSTEVGCGVAMRGVGGAAGGAAIVGGGRGKEAHART
ncbi:hypothetical protein EVAR_83708_1 [Eumeta japonica]|uniref:Uncharacterized protein n=1 Tax=Eumeta variegata TaxID=151549 RepID=A0A4C1WCZ7_EUMVA|nr:hypothetical protein EVAR_83708_1 [Eumeta japonica]